MQFSISRADLIRHCQAPFRSDWPAPPRAKTRPETTIGSIFHDSCARLIAEPDLLGSDQELERCAQLATELRVPGTLEQHIELFERLDARRHVADLLELAPRADPEVAYAIDPSTGAARELGVNIGRKYRQFGMRDGEFGGSADVVWSSRDVQTGQMIVHIRDWKVSFGMLSHVAPAEQNGQLALLAHAACSVLGAQQAHVEIFAIDGRTGSTWTDSAKIKRIALMRRAAELGKLLAASDAQPTPGRHCVSHYCPFVSTCPAVQQGIEQLDPSLPSSMLFPVVQDASSIRSQQHAAHLYELVRQTKRAAGALESVLQDYAEQNDGIEVEPGVRWGPVPNRRQYITSRCVEDFIEALEPYLSVADIGKLVSVSVTKSALEKALKDANKNRDTRYTMDDVMDALERAGIAKTRNYEDKFIEKKKDG